MGPSHVLKACSRRVAGRGQTAPAATGHGTPADGAKLSHYLGRAGLWIWLEMFETVLAGEEVRTEVRAYGDIGILIRRRVLRGVRRHGYVGICCLYVLRGVAVVGTEDG